MERSNLQNLPSKTSNETDLPCTEIRKDLNTFDDNNRQHLNLFFQTSEHDSTVACKKVEIDPENNNNMDYKSDLLRRSESLSKFTCRTS